ncbi:uncharacterized protein LOC128291581 [Gossypium arboreum]|uniref:uncharacterized protein LOC128291581 n=1 Tax=Gossypium arboreum TaxID=29729 RepID=UPI0022F19B3C|nr:uncharacterized protein LOC128291581 [Gossypium arboreum]
MCRRFEDGLNEDIRLLVGILELKEFVVIVDRACKAEELTKERRRAEAKARDIRKRPMSRHSYRNHKKQNSGFRSQATFVASVGNDRAPKPECQQCGRGHFGKRRVSDGACFQYGSQDHYIKDCPEMAGKEKFQSTRPGSTATKGRPSRNTSNGASSKNVTRDTTVRYEARASARANAIPVREDASSPDVITEMYEKGM